jgi:DNA gyrase subunit B
MATKSKTPVYDSTSIDTLRFPYDVRANPGVYLGSVDAAGVWVAVREPLDNVVDEFLAGRGSNVHLHVDADGSYWVADDATGIPQGIKKHVAHINGKDIEVKTPTMQAIFGELHTSGKYRSEAYKVSRGTHGIGVKGTNATAEYFEAWTYYKGKWYSLRFEGGVLKRKVAECKAPKLWDKTVAKLGTVIHFKPDPKIFTAKSFPASVAIEWAELAAYLTPGFTVRISSPKGEREFFSKTGPTEYVQKMMEKAKVEGERLMFQYKSELADVIVAFTNFDGFAVKGFTNGLSQSSGGKHVESVSGALYAALKPWIKTKKTKIDGKVKEVPAFREADLREGMLGIVNMYLHKATYSSQDKGKLTDDRAGAPFEAMLEVEASKFFASNKALAQRLADQATKMNELKTKFTLSKKAASKLKVLKRGGLPPKFASWDPRTKITDRELFIVEGDSAGGCFVGSALVQLLNGEQKRFDKMAAEAEQGIEHFGYAYDLREQQIKVIKFDTPRLTKYVDELIEVTLSNGKVVQCTPDHPWLTRGGEYVAAEKLEPGLALMPHTEFVATERHVAGRRVVVSPKKSPSGKPSKRGLRAPVFHLSVQLRKDEMRKKKRLEAGGIKTNIHHTDFDRLNDLPSNLEVMAEAEHRTLHAKLTDAFAGFESGDENAHAIKMHADQAYRKKFVSRAKKFFSSYWGNTENRHAQSVRTSHHFADPSNRQRASVKNSDIFKARWLEIASAAATVNKAEWERAKRKLHPRLNLRFESWSRYFNSFSEAQRMATHGGEE